MSQDYQLGQFKDRRTFSSFLLSPSSSIWLLSLRDVFAFFGENGEIVRGWMLTCLLYAVILPKENESASELLTQRWPGYGRHGDCGGAHQQPFTTYAFEKSVRVHIRLDWSLWRYEFRGLVLAACPNHAFGSGDISLVANEF